MRSLTSSVYAAVVGAFLYCSPLAAASFNFADIPWDSSLSNVKTMLQAKGFKSERDKDGDLLFEGELAGYKVMGVAMFGNEGLAKINIGLITPSDKARQVYRDLRETLVNKYGAPSDTYEFFRQPYYLGDGHEDQAIRLGKATFATFWTSGAGALVITITEVLTIRLGYEGPRWHVEAARRKAKSDRREAKSRSVL